MKYLLLAAATAASLILPVAAAEPAPAPSPGEIVAAAPANDWIAITASDLLVMELAPDAKGKPRRVVIQLMPAPFSQGWIGNIRKLAAAHWWDGTSINRVQDNYVVQWGDATEKKALPEGLATVPESAYEMALGEDVLAALRAKMKADEDALRAAFRQPGDGKIRAIKRAIPRDPYADETITFQGWPIAVDRQTQTGWPVHCYAMVGVGRNLSPDTGSGAELYAVIGHAPRHLDRNIALVGRVVSGIEHLSSLPRGTEALGFYNTEAERTPIASIRIASELPTADQPRFEYLSTESDSFAPYADARANRRDPFFVRPAGGADICNIPVPVRPVAAQ
ncbi:putative secreted peptidyl prolyl cis-trans isomerase, cyclophilin type [uncultured Sphingopyxis sp.]|uniref:Putative secreted peptidyl prolyl cis-trans isomerase, cyclophilin type n=1 Tax=uncultured Sphingopyxis sp. TaxID=310581 RepID=A0A1Y5PVR4_9SPHN|nr:peptidylprolyl isomerase [uncultured Sphingopyxis sp.]SBV32715.1 putative secreted peptidyl prolyl cis-trans isomerase, cyclophilin type [uncultured Sphingopyxis sp.]